MNTQLKIEQMQATLKEVGERIDELVSGGVEFGPDVEDGDGEAKEEPQGGAPSTQEIDEMARERLEEMERAAIESEDEDEGLEDAPPPQSEGDDDRLQSGDFSAEGAPVVEGPEDVEGEEPQASAEEEPSAPEP